jgi:type IV secretory pathway TraG/TraD family ATPase VirD4
MSTNTSYRFFGWLLDLKLNIRMMCKVFFVFMLLYILAIITIMCTAYESETLKLALFFKYSYSSLMAGKVTNFLYNLANGLEQSLELLGQVFVKNLFIWILFPLVLFIFSYFKNTDKDFVRGAKLLSHRDFKNQINEISSLPIGWDLKLPISAEIKHMLILGKTGSGKTNTLNQMLVEVRRRKKKALVYDVKGDYLAKFYNPETDLIFNPVDMRCVGWNIFNEVESVMDLVVIANAIIPSAPGNTDPTWYNVPRDILYGILLYCWLSKRRTNKDVWQVLCMGTKEISEILNYTQGAERAYVGLGDPTTKTAQNLMMMVMQFAKVFEFLQHIDGDFSIKKWVESDNKNFIFVADYKDLSDILQPGNALFIEILGRKLLTLADDLKRRLFIFLDEFASLQKLEIIVDLLNLSRSKGGAIFIGTQDIGRIDARYGKEVRESIINACGNNLIFKVEDATTADFCSKKLGETEYYEDQKSQSYGEKSERVSTSTVKRNEKLVLPSQIQALKDLTAYLKVANYGITFTQFTYQAYPSINESVKIKKQFMLYDSDDINTDKVAENEPILEKNEAVVDNQVHDLKRLLQV